MITCGIDIGKCKHAVAILDEHGKELCKAKFYDNTKADADKLLEELLKHATPDQIRVGMESTGTFWRAYHDYLDKAGCNVEVINPLITSASMAGDVRGRKTDKQDAKKIAMVVFMGDYVRRRPEGVEARKLKAITRQRGFLVEHRTDAKLRCGCLMAEAFPEFESLLERPCFALLYGILSKYPTAAAMKKARVKTLATIIHDASRGRDAEAEAKRLIEAAKNSICADCEAAEELGEAIRSTLDYIAALNDQIKEIEKKIKSFEPPKTASMIKDINGSGDVLPMVIAAEYGDIERFRKDPKTGSEKGMNKRMLAFAGCECRIRQSGKWQGMDKISKRGSGDLRASLYRLGNSIRMHDDYFKSIYEEKRKTKHHNVAIFCVVAKFLEVLCSCYKSGRRYTTIKPSAQVINSQNPVINKTH